jgi:hypothetical protein
VPLRQAPQEPKVTDDKAFAALLDTFAAAGVANDGARFAGLFTEQGTYDDLFFGLHRGRTEIAAMLQRFHDTGRDYRWEFADLVSDGARGYARFGCSFASRLPGCEGKPVYFAGMSLFRFAQDGLIAEYREAWDRGAALVQLGFPAERIRRVVEKAGAEQVGSLDGQAHLARFRSQS